MSTYGIGNVGKRKLADGRIRYRARVPNGAGGHKTIGVYDTFEEAESALKVAAERRESGALVIQGETLRTFGPGFLARRAANGGRNGKTDANRWSLHILTAPFADWPLVSIAPKHVAAWIDRLRKKRAKDKRGARPISAQTIRHAVALLRRALQLALQRGLVSINAAAGHELPKVRNEGWTYLMPEEIERLIGCEAIPEHDRLAIQFAIGTGLRQGEQWNLELRDLHIEEGEQDPHLIVRYGKPPGHPGGRAPKNGRIRRVELFGLGLDAARRWLELLPTWAERNPARIMWPTQRGHRRRDGKPPRGWSKAYRKDPTDPAGKRRAPTYLEAAGLADPKKRHDGRGVRWHDLRHTDAAALVSGWWGRRWRLEEIKEQLGHTSTKVTERYAHLAPGVLAEAARGTGRGP